MLHDLKPGTAATSERGHGEFWHPIAVWCGPTGLGTARGHAAIAGLIFKQFRDRVSDNIRQIKEGVFFGDHDSVAFTGWPSGTAIHSGDGFLGLAPTGRRITRLSLDFCRVERGFVKDCWVIVDMLDLYRQLGIGVFARTRMKTQR
ncbi:MAG: ester cyclase [Pseudomonadota bacterium]